jgi:hypothetical protein
MTYLVSIDKTITYLITIHPFPVNKGRQDVYISNVNFDNNSTTANYYLESFSFNNDVFDPIQTGTARIVQPQYGIIDFFSYVQEGDLLYISETQNNITTNIFSGYVEALQLYRNSDGTIITLNFVNLLKQISISNIFGLILNQIQTAKQILMADFLNRIIQNTLIQPSVLFSGNPTFTFYGGVGESPGLTLNGENTIYITITSYMTILQAINKVIYPYQRYIYQDNTGAIVIAPLTLFNDSIWNFDQYNPSQFREANFNFPYTELSIKKNAGSSYNQTYGTLMNIPIALNPTSYADLIKRGFYSQFTPSSTYFDRLNQLRSSGNFTITDIVIEDLISDPSKIDITLVNISELVQGTSVSGSVAQTIAVVNQVTGQLPLKSSSGGSDITSILFNYVARTMSENLVSETEVYITCPRTSQTDFTGNLLPLPINKIVNLTLDPGILDTTALFCRGYSLSYSNAGTIVTLNLCKPLSGGAYWVNGGLVNVS